MKEIELSQYGNNIKIKAQILPDKKMRKLGFTDYSKDRWCFLKSINFSKEKRYKGFDISLYVVINKLDSTNLKIDIIDEDFGHPYDYQMMLKKNPKFEPCLIVKAQVEEWMKYLKDNSVLSGHEYGDYI